MSCSEEEAPQLVIEGSDVKKGGKCDRKVAGARVGCCEFSESDTVYERCLA